MAVAISILVPVFNVEKYLRQCLDSIQSQTFKNFEVICINDGSTDTSLAILEDYAQQDTRFRIINKPNSGYGHSMNIGLGQCNGEYIGIVESDDYIEPTMFETLYHLAKTQNLDVARCNYYCFTQHDKFKQDLHYIPVDTVVRPLDEAAIFYQAPSIWVNLYRKEFLNQNNIRFLETPGASYQDTSFSFKVYAYCQRFMFIDQPLLNYRTDSANSSINNKDKVFCVCAEYDEILSFAKQHEQIYQRLKYHIPMLRFGAYSWNYSRIHPKYRMDFLKTWGKAIAADVLAERIHADVTPFRKRKKMWFIRHLPIVYKWRKKAL